MDDGRPLPGLVGLCIEAAAASMGSVEKWRRQRRTLERLPSQLADALFRRLLQRRLLFPSLLEVFQHCVEDIDLRGEGCVDAEWMAYLGAFRYLRTLSLADCRAINNSALWPITGMTTLKELDLSRCSKITDSGMQHLLSNRSLEKLYVSETKLTSDGIMCFTSLKHLRVLDLGGLPVTDKALYALKALSQLEHLDLWGSKISDKGAAILNMFPKLSFLNLAWTNVHRLPDLPSITCLNMSHCTIHSIFDGASGLLAPLSELILSGAEFIDVDEAFSFLQPSFISLLDLSRSSISDFQFLVDMKGLEQLNLSFSRMTDNMIENIAGIGANMKSLDLCNTKTTSRGLSVLVGNVPNLESLSLCSTAVDDTSLQYMGMMPSLRMIDIRSTNIKGFTYCGEDHLDKTLSLTALQNLSHLKSLNLEETQLTDETMRPLFCMKELKSLYLKSDFLTDISLHALSRLPHLVILGFRGAVLTNSGLHLFRPPPRLRKLDLQGCWLLTEDVISSFCKRHPRIEVRHEHCQISSANQNLSVNPSPLCGTTRMPQLRLSGTTPMPQKLSGSSGLPNDKFVDERMKYSREELLDLQHSPSENLAVATLRPLLPKVLTE